jgi:hypothetical protein
MAFAVHTPPLAQGETAPVREKGKEGEEAESAERKTKLSSGWSLSLSLSLSHALLR